MGRDREETELDPPPQSSLPSLLPEPKSLSPPHKTMTHVAPQTGQGSDFTENESNAFTVQQRSTMTRFQKWDSNRAGGTSWSFSKISFSREVTDLKFLRHRFRRILYRQRKDRKSGPLTIAGISEVPERSNDRESIPSLRVGKAWSKQDGDSAR